MDAKDLPQASFLPSSEDMELLRYFIEEAGLLLDTQTSISKRPPAATAPLSFAQRRLWFLSQLEPDKPIYNVRFMARIRGPLRLGAFQASLSLVIQRHEILRTTFAFDGYEPVQVIHPSVEIFFPLVDLSGLPEAERQSHLHHLVQAETRGAFHLEQGPLLRGLLLRLHAEEHIFFLKLHHIITDGWSRGIFLREVGSVYEAFLAGRPSPLPELPIQYADFAVWQRQQLQEKRLASLQDYWCQRLAGAPPLLELPLDHPRPPIQRYAGAVFSTSFSLDLSNALKTFSQQEGVTLFMTLLAAFKTLLLRLSGQEDIVIGAFIANRTHKELENLIGFFVNTLVLRTDLTGNPTFRELLQRVRQTALAAYDHQDYPFEMLVEALQPERNLSYHPLIQVMFQLDNTPFPSLKVADLSLESAEFDKETSPFDLAFLLSEMDQGLSAQVEYNTDLFERMTIMRMLAQFQMVLESIVATPSLRLSDIPLLSRAEQEQLLITWNATQSPYPENYCIHHLFEEQALLHPSAIALFFEGQHLSYQALNARANALALQLRQHGVGPNVAVGLFVERSLEMAIGLLGILKAGGAYVPLDPHYPAQRLSFILKDAQAPVLLTHSSLLSRLPDSQARVMLIEPALSESNTEGCNNPINTATIDDLAYIIYTSGSTGQPKGVCLPHRSLTNLFCWHRRTLIQGARTLQFASLNFDASIHELFAAWCSGGVALIVPETIRQDTTTLAHYLITQQIEKAILPVVVLQQLAEIYSKQLELPDRLREAITTGEQLRITAPVRALFERLNGCRLHNHYSPSETNVLTAYTLPEDPETWPTYPPIGRPISNTQLYVLDQYHLPVPPGVAGELYIGGHSLARGYLHQPDLTAKRFIGPFPALAASRLYWTGDLVRYLPDGNLVFIGRRDQQVKLRGFRIELEELTGVLCKHPAICEAIVDVQEDGLGEKRLVAYLVPDPQRTVQESHPQDTVTPATSSYQPLLTVNEVRQFLLQELPGYMVPSAFVFLEALPLNANGKIVRRALPRPVLQRPELGTEFVAPRTTTEEILAGIWSKVFNLPQIGIY